MSMTLIEQIKRDRDHKRKGAQVDGWSIEIDVPCPGWVCVRGPAFEVSGATIATDLNGQDFVDRHKDARRIARLPELETAYIALVEENERLKKAADELASAYKTLLSDLKAREAADEWGGKDCGYRDKVLAAYREART